MKSAKTALFITIVAIAMAMILVGCGGGGGSGSSGSMPSFTAAAATATAAEEPVAAPEPTPVSSPSKVTGCTVGYWGDSIAGLTTPHMDKRLQMSGHAVIGGTAQAAQATLLQDELAERFQVVEYGTNDSNSMVPFEPAMRAMLDRIKAKGRTPVLTGLSNATVGEMAYRATYNAITGQLAKEYGAIFANWAAVPWSPSDLKADGVHPNEDYQKRLADRLSAVILEAAPECK